MDRKKPTSIEIPVRLDSETFEEFSLFDVFRLRGHWRTPALFALLMTGFACACFVLNNQTNQGGLLGTVLLAVGLLLPLVYVGRYLASVKAQCKKMGLDAPGGRPVYTVTLTEDTVTRRSGGATEQSALADVYGVWRKKNVIYLYLDAAHALLLPDGQANLPQDELWALLTASLPAAKCHEVR